MNNKYNIELTWETKDNGLIKIKDMSNRHLVNVIKLIRRRAVVTVTDALFSMSIGVSGNKGMYACLMGELDTNVRDYLQESELYQAMLYLAEKRMLNVPELRVKAAEKSNQEIPEELRELKRQERDWM